MKDDFKYIKFQLDIIMIILGFIVGTLIKILSLVNC